MNTKTKTTVFVPRKGGTVEYHVMITVTDPSLGYKDQLNAVMEACAADSEGRTVHFRRFFLSDASNQAPQLQEALLSLPDAATSVVQQPPLDGTRIAAWMYCTSSMEGSDGFFTHEGYEHHWAGSLTGEGVDSYEQMAGIFLDLDAKLGQRGLSVAANTIRTWIFARDVDVNYNGVVVARRQYFERIGLTSKSHFIASTGIEGRHPDSRKLVETDAYSVGGLASEQVRFLYAKDHLSPTMDYGVTFERGTAVTYGDRRQVYISGTASIDAEGKVMYPGDVSMQTRRMLENISALLKEAGAKLKDIAMAVVYLREAADYSIVRKIVMETCPDLNAVFVLAPVCRPAWLVEMECLALVPCKAPEFRPF